jgi:hypothetical protein
MMNIWALKKATELKALLLLLQDRLTPETWVIASEEAGDSKSVRIHNQGEPALAAYISLHGQPSGYFTVHLEYPIVERVGRFNNTQVAENLNEMRALDLLVMHLG